MVKANSLCFPVVIAELLLCCHNPQSNPRATVTGARERRLKLCNSASVDFLRYSVTVLENRRQAHSVKDRRTRPCLGGKKQYHKRGSRPVLALRALKFIGQKPSMHRITGHL